MKNTTPFLEIVGTNLVPIRQTKTMQLYVLKDGGLAQVKGKKIVAELAPHQWKYDPEYISTLISNPKKKS